MPEILPRRIAGHPDRRQSGHGPEGILRPPTRRERGIFSRRRHIASHARREQRAKLIPEMRRDAGKIIRKLRTTTSEEPIPAQQFGESMGTTAPIILEAERGRRNIDLNRAYLVAKEYFHSEGEEMSGELSELRKIRNFVEEEKLMNALTKKDLTLRNAIMLFRLNELLTQPEFAAIAGYEASRQYDYEAGRDIPTSTYLNKIIATSGLESDSMPAQQLRLLRRLAKYNEKPMSLDELQTCSFGRLMQYLRQLKGAIHTDLAEEWNFAPSTISNLENDVFLPPAHTVEEFLLWLKIHPESPLARIIVRKAKKSREPISEEMLSGVLKQQYLFAESLQTFTEQTESDKDEQLIKNLRAESSAKKMIRLLIMPGDQDISLTQIAKKMKMPHVTLWDSVSGKHFPKDTTVVLILMRLGYDIFHPVTQFLLKRLEQDKIYATYQKNLIFSTTSKRNGVELEEVAS